MFLENTPILAYHSITEPDAPPSADPLAISVSEFERQMSYLHASGYQCVSMEAIMNTWKNGQAMPPKTFGLTFDDGYEDFASLALPILQRFGFTATIFLVTEHVGSKSNWPGEAGTPLLSWTQIRALAKEGMTFGSHTCSHPRLPCVPEKTVWKELTLSKQQIENELGQAVHLLAYPYGHSNADVRRLVGEAGYVAAFGQRTGRSGPYNVWRRMAHAHESLLAFRLKMTRWHQYPTWFRQESRFGEVLRRAKHILLGPPRWPTAEYALSSDRQLEERCK